MRGTFLVFCFAGITTLSFCQTPTDSLNLSRSLRADSIAAAFLKKNKLDSALFYARRALSWRRSVGEKSLVAKSYIQLGEIAERRRKPKDALDYFRAAAKSARASGDPIIKDVAYARVIKALRAADNYREAYFYQTLVTATHDSLSAARLSAQARLNADITGRLDSTSVTSEAAILAREKEIQSVIESRDQALLQYEDYRQLSFYIYAGAGIVILLLLVSRWSASSRLAREKKRHQRADTDRVTLAKDIREEFHARLSSIQRLSEEISLKGLTPDLKKHLFAISDMSSRMIWDVRDLVSTMNGKEAGLQELVHNIEVYAKDFFKGHQTEVVSRTANDLPEVVLSKPAFRAVLLATKEIFHQVARQSKPLNVYLTFSSDEKRMTITAHDDGIGLSYDPDNREGWYLWAKEKLQAAGGLLSITKEEVGTRFRIDIQLPESLKARRKKKARA